MRGKKLIAVILSALFFLSLQTALAAADKVVSIKINNAHQLQEAVELYFSTDATGNIGKKDVSVAYCGSKLNVSSVNRFCKSGEGVSYIFLVDVSGSMKTEINKTKALLKNTVAGMKPSDKAAVVTVADSVKPGSFTSKKSSLISQINTLTATNGDTSLYKGITSSIDMFDSYSGKIPALEALVVVSDGDEDYNSGITKDEVLSKITGAHIPVFTYVTLPSNPSDKQIAASKIFGSFARSSAGGVDFPYTQDQKSAANGIISAIQNSYAVKASMDTEKYKSQRQYLELAVKTGGLTVKDGYDFRAESSVQTSFPLNIKHDTNPVKPVKKFDILKMLLKPQVLIPTAAGIVLLAAVIILLVVSKKRKAKSGAAPIESEPVEAATQRPGQVDFSDNNNLNGDWTDAQPPQTGGTVSMPSFESSIGATVPIMGQKAKKTVTKSCAIRLVNLSANSKHDVYELTIKDTLVIGRSRQQTGLAFTEDTMMSGRHCQLSYINNDIFINDLGSANGTFVNGVTINGSYKLESDDVISIGSTELRIIFDSADGR